MITKSAVFDVADKNYDYYGNLRWAASQVPAGRHIIEAGTCHGHGACALAAFGHTVHTYDPFDPPLFTPFPCHVIPHKASCLDADPELLRTAALIYLDIDPHAGKEESLFYDLLDDVGFRGTLICDDINLTPGMAGFWAYIARPKLLLIGEHALGFVDFSGDWSNISNVQQPSEIHPDYNEYLRYQIEDCNPDRTGNGHYDAAILACVKAALAASPPNPRVLDIGSGPGVALNFFAKETVQSLAGVEINAAKCEKSRLLIPSARVECCDFHDLSCFEDASFDLIYSSNTLEHAYYPDRVFTEVKRLLAPGGRFFLVLPYIDGTVREWPRAHCASYTLGLTEPDDAKTLISYVSRFFTLISRACSPVEGNEIWLVLANA